MDPDHYTGVPTLQTSTSTTVPTALVSLHDRCSVIHGLVGPSRGAAEALHLTSNLVPCFGLRQWSLRPTAPFRYLSNQRTIAVMARIRFDVLRIPCPSSGNSRYSTG